MGLEIMNKIVVDKEIITVKDAETYLDIRLEKVTINCLGKNLLIINAKENLNLNIFLTDNSFVEILVYNKAKMGDNKIQITQENNTTINYYEAFSSKGDTKVSLKNIVNGDNNKSNIKFRCLSNKYNVQLNICAEALKHTKNNDITEDIKGINNGGNIVVEPIMEINTHDILANHFVTIGSINKDYLFYLESKGIKESTAKKIICDGFLKSIFSKYQDILFGGEDNE